MPLQLNCACGHHYKLPSLLAGVRGRCPRCDALMTAPEAPASVVNAGIELIGDDSVGEILAAAERAQDDE